MSKQQVKSFAVGDRVTWKSQASGHWKQKTGTVVEVVPAFKIPRDKNFGSNRRHESYIVEVTFEPKRSTSAIKSVRTKNPERYWPRVSNLRLVKRGSTSTTEAAPSVPAGGHGIEGKMVNYDQRSSEQLSAAIESDAAAGGLRVDHLPVKTIDGGGDLLWKDVQDAERAIANANSESTN
jgi:hypothetical protein